MKKYLLTTLLAIMVSNFSYSQNASGEDFLTRAIDKSVSPGEDFFNYATGTWMKNNPIPKTESSWTVGHLVEEENYARLNQILEEASKSKSEKGTNKQKIGDLYFSGMDTETINELGITPLKPEMELIDGIKDRKSLFNTISTLKKEGVGVMFSAFVEQDAMNSSKWVLYLWQGGLGLPNREYYYRNDARTENIRKEYKKHIAKMFTLMGYAEGDALKSAEKVYEMEVFLADSSRKLEDLRDPYENYNKMEVSELKKKYKDVDWSLLFDKTGVKKLKTVIVGQPEFLLQVNNAVSKFSIEDWKLYLKWHVIDSFAELLSEEFEKENFYFSGTVMSGITEQRPRWKRIQDVVEEQLGELLGQVYVEKFYSPATKKRYEKLVDDIIDAFRERIKKLDWMTEVTKKKAIKKLNSITKKVGYPDKWKDYSKLSISRDEFLRNYINANVFLFEKNIDKLGKPVDRNEWSMTPQTYNAYYNPSNNEMVLPAAIFIIPGVPDSLLDDAIIYSYAGASTIGHELTHGFDDQGREYDEKGNLANWWTKKDTELFDKKTVLMVEQFNNFVVLDSMHINGEATLGENIADLGGVVTGLDAFKKTEQYKKGTVINGLTPMQRFWLGYAYSWLGHERPERLARQIMTDVHSPAKFRINGPLSNLPEFYETFGIKQGDKMWRPEDKRVKIW